MGIGGNTALLGRQMLDQEFRLVKEYDNVTPNKAIIMFGMNDVNMTAGETAETNLEKYSTNMSDLIDAVYAKGVEEIIVMSSTPYDDTLENEDVPISSGFADARSRMLKYAEMLKALTKEKNCHFINLTEIMYTLLDEYQKNDKSITFINASDRVHPKEFGNYIMAYIIAASQGMGNINSEAVLTLGSNGAYSDSELITDIVCDSDACIGFSYTPSGKAIGITTPYAYADSVIPLTKDFNQEIVKISGMPSGYYEIDIDGSKTGPYTSEQLEKGINLALIPNTPITQRTAQLYGDMFAGHKIVTSYLRNIRTAEKKAMQSGIDLNDDEAVKEYVENASDELKAQFRNAYINYKETEKDLFDEFSFYSDKLYEDAKNTTPVKITIQPNTVANDSVIWYENFTDGTNNWKTLQINGNASSAEEYGKAVYETVTGAETANASGAGSVKIEIGLNKCRNYLTLVNHINVLEGLKYKVSANIKTENVRETDLANMTAMFYASDGATILSQTDIADTQRGTHDWISISETLTAPAGAAYLRLDISGRCMTEGATEKQGVIWFDDVRVSTPVTNPDFEASVNNVVSGWTTSDVKSPVPETYSTDLMTFKDTSGWKANLGGTAVTFSYDKENYVTGDKSVKFVSTAEGASTDRYYLYPSTENYIKLMPDTSYKITMKAKTENYKLLSEFSQSKPAGVTYQALLYEETDGGVDTTKQYSLTSSYMNVPGSTEAAADSDWSDYSMILTTPSAKAGQEYQYLRSNIMMRFASGTAWVDSITVEECDENGTVVSIDNVDTENKVSGDNSLVIKGETSKVTYISEPFAVTGASKYMLSAYVKGDNNASFKLGIELYNSQYQKISETNFDASVSDEFELYDNFITVPVDCVYAIIALSAQNGSINVDDVALSQTVYNAPFESDEQKEELPALGDFTDLVTVEKVVKNNTVTLIISPITDEAVPDMTLYSAIYNEDTSLKSVSSANYSAAANGNIEIELPQVNTSSTETHKIMLWDKNLAPIIDSIK